MVRASDRFPILPLSDDELLGQGTAAAVTRAAGLNVSDGAVPTTEKIAAASEEARALLEEVARVTQVLDLKLADHDRHRDAIRAIQWALVRRRQVRGRYKSPYDRRVRDVVIHPYRLCLVKSAWYLIGRPDSSDTPRTYRIVRFEALEVDEAPAEVPVKFDLRAYFGNAWGVFRGSSTYEVELAFDSTVAEIVTETVWHHTQETNWLADGGVVLRFRVDGLEEIARWIVGWAGDVTVIQPNELRHAVIDAHRRALARNTCVGDGSDDAGDREATWGEQPTEGA